MKIFSFICFTAVLFGTAVIDARTKHIPKFVHWLLLAIGIARILSTGPPDQIVNNLLYSIAGMALGFVPLFLLGIAKGGVGGGDIKLAGSAGFALAQPNLVLLYPGAYWAILGSLLLFLLGKLYFKVRDGKRLSVPMPFAPYFAAAGIGTYFLQLIWRMIT
ncbi:prepilin peptidase [Ethanoligenens sp.]|uniref:prepilin peptidase n=1 Tax=Ethanoligenens sp. TaxID=2099655 RepID=UPI0039EB2E12